MHAVAPHEVERFGKYALLRRLGRGGMAETWIASRQGADGVVQLVCVKRILPHLLSDPSFLRLFVEEAAVSARLRHNNVAQVMDFGTAGERTYLALELIDGADLRSLVRELRTRGEALTPGIVAHVAAELAQALAYAHSGTSGQVIVHRDLSPSNVLLSRAGEVKLSDFGIAKALGERDHTQTAVIKGKVPYMAPEYARHGIFEPRSDLYALGILLYESLTGRRPYRGRTDVETIELATAGDHRPVKALAPNTPQALADIVEKLIRPRAEDRFRSAEEMLRALGRVSPPTTARLILGRLVSGVPQVISAEMLEQLHELAKHPDFAPTPRTQVLRQRAEESDGGPRAAGAADRTRTREHAGAPGEASTPPPRPMLRVPTDPDLPMPAGGRDRSGWLVAAAGVVTAAAVSYWLFS